MHINLVRASFSYIQSNGIHHDEAKTKENCVLYVMIVNGIL